MRLATWVFALAGLTSALSLASGQQGQQANPAQPANPPGKITWKKTVVDKVFRGEGIAVGDINKDGKLDLISGELWYEAPDWKPHPIIEKLRDHKDGLGNYSNTFACWADDINKDGWVDVIVIDFPGAPCYWFENPQGKSNPWKKHIIWHSACNETPLYVDLFGKGQRVLLMGWQPEGKGNEGQMAYFTPGTDSTQKWTMHPISEPSTAATFKFTQDAFKTLATDPTTGTLAPKLAALKDAYASEKDFQAAVVKAIGKEDFDTAKAKIMKAATVPGKEIPGTQRFSHGLGAADVNGDGKLDVLCTGGWWEQPASIDDKPWKFHAARLGEACADMHTVDLDGDGKLDIISSSAHKFGIWAHLQRGDKDSPTFVTEVLFKELVSETHALHFVDIDGDGLKDLVTGKRFWSHGRAEPGANGPAMIYWLKAVKKGGILSFVPQEIDNDSGIGTQFEVRDLNGDGLLDVIVSNKKGTHVLIQERAK